MWWNSNASRSFATLDTSSASKEEPPKPKKKYHNEPSLRVRVVPMFADNYGASPLPSFCVEAQLNMAL
jgi:hypothetical protein